MSDDGARRDLAFIRQVIEEGRGYVAIGAGHLVIWGTGMGAAALLHFAKLRGWPLPSGATIWQAAQTVAWIASIILGMAEDHRCKVRSLSTRLLPQLWLGLGIALTILYAGIRTLAPETESLLPASVAATMGIGFFVTGAACGYRWVQAVAALWWIAVPLCVALRHDSLLLPVLAALYLALLAIPGLLLLRHRAPLVIAA